MERFFSLIWRANALIVFAAGLAGIALVAVVFFQLAREFREPRRVAGVVNLADEEIESESFHFGSFEPIAGSSYLSAPLYTDQGYPLGSISKVSRASRNYLFFNPQDSAAHWLLPNNKGLVEWRRQFPQSRGMETPEPVVAVLWEIIDQDSTGDLKLTENDLSSIYASGPAGTPLKLLVSGVQEVLGANQTASNTAFLMFLKENDLRAAAVNLESLSLVSDEKVSTLPKSIQ